MRAATPMDSNSIGVTSPIAARPDWRQLDEEVRCPLCEYNLRGLVQPRCPECGYEFVWSDLLDPSRRLHPTLFEHHPERNFWSFRKTLLGGFRPRRFWTSLHPAQPSSVKRLILYWACCTSIILLAVLCELTFTAVSLARVNAAAQRTQIAWFNTPAPNSYRQQQLVIQEYGSLQAYMERWYPTSPLELVHRIIQSPDFMESHVFPAIIPIAWPWVTFLSLLVFVFSMRRARVKPSHILRCSLYCSDIFLWLSFVIFVVQPAMIHLGSGTRSDTFTVLATLMVVCFWLFMLVSLPYRLIIAYRKYLRFPHAVAVILSSQFIVGLVMMIITLRVTIH